MTVTEIYEKICESAGECNKGNCPHLRPHKTIKNGGSICILHTCQMKPGYKICRDGKWYE